MIVIYSGIYIFNFLQKLGCAKAFLWAEIFFQDMHMDEGGGGKLTCPKIIIIFIIIIIICEKLKCEWRTRRL